MYDKSHRIALNMIMNVILTLSNYIFPLLTYGYVARVLQPEGTGKISFVQSVITYFSFVAALGVSQYGLRESAKARENRFLLSKTTKEIFIINILSTIVAYILLASVVIIIGKFREDWLLFAVLGLSMLLTTMGMEWLYKGLELFPYIAIRSVVFKIIALVLTFIFVKDKQDILVYAGISVFSLYGAYIINFVHSKKYVDLTVKCKLDLKKHIKPLLVFFSVTAVTTIHAYFDIIILGFIYGNTEVGLYNAAVKIRTAVTALSTGITGVLVPGLSVYYSSDYEKFRRLLVLSLRVSLVLMLPLSFVVMFSPRQMLTFVCGSQYESVYPALILLMICTLVLAVTNILGNQVLVAARKENYYSKIVFVAMIVNVVLDLVLVPQFKTIGAAIATLIAEIFVAVFFAKGCPSETKYLWKNINVKLYLIAILASSIPEFIAIKLTEMFPSLAQLVIRSIVLFGFYFGTLIAMREPLLYELIVKLKKRILSNGR